MRKPWERREGESEKAYQAFLFYREERANSLLDAYCAYCEWRWSQSKTRAKCDEARETGQAPSWFAAWSSKYDWVERRNAYYLEVDRRAADELMDSKARRKVERVELLDDVKAIIDEEGLPFLRDALEEGELGVGDFVRLLDKLLTHYRDELNDLPTEHHEHDVDEGAAERLAKALGVDLEGE